MSKVDAIIIALESFVAGMLVASMIFVWPTKKRKGEGK